MIKRLLIAFISIACLSACGDVDYNGDLDGQWQLMQIEEEDGSLQEEKEKRIYYSVQQKLMSLRQIGNHEYLCRFQHTGDSLFISDIVRNDDNSIIATQEDVAIFGLTDITERFAVEHLSKKKLILKSTKKRLHLRKF